MARLFDSSYDHPWRGLPSELRNLIYHHLLCPPGGLRLVPYVHRDGLLNKSAQVSRKLYVEEQRYSYNDSEAYNYDRHYPAGRSDPTVDKDGFSAYDRGLLRDPLDKIALKREQLLPLGILWTNKQTHDEALRHLCAQNSWQFDTRCDRILHFLQWLDPAYRLRIRDLRLTSESTLRYKGNDRHRDLTAFLSDEMKLRSVTVAMPEGYHVRSYLYSMGERRHIPDIYIGLVKSVFDAKLDTVRIHYDHSDAAPTNKPFHRLEPVAIVYRMYETCFKDGFYDLIAATFPEWTKEFEGPQTGLEHMSWPDETRPIQFDQMIQDHRNLYPIRISLESPEQEHDETGPVLVFHVDVNAAKAEMKLVEDLIVQGEIRHVEEAQARMLGKPAGEWPSLQSRLNLAKGALQRFEDQPAWKDSTALLKPGRPLVKRLRSSYLGET